MSEVKVIFTVYRSLGLTKFVKLDNLASACPLRFCQLCLLHVFLCWLGGHPLDSGGLVDVLENVEVDITDLLMVDRAEILEMASATAIWLLSRHYFSQHR